MKSIYRSEYGKNKIIELYDSQLTRLNVPWKDIYVQTSFGRTHLIETGNTNGVPLVVFHGGNATTAYNLLSCDFLHSVMDAGFFCAEHLVMICEFGGVCGLYFKSLSLVEYMTVFR